MSERRLSLRTAARRALVALGLAMLWAWLAPLQVRAEELDVSGPLYDVPLGQRVDLLEDPDATLSFAQVSAPGAPFHPSLRQVPSFGFTASALWLRLRVTNKRADERAWLLDLGYPLLDEVVVYTPGETGYTSRAAGDMLPFAQRDLACRNVVFRLREPPNSERTYYLRVQTSGALTVPLTAWSLREFLEHQHHDWAALCIFYGVVLIMALYSLGVYLATKQREYLPYAACIACIGVFQFTASGHASQFLLRDEFWLVHRLLPSSVFAAMFFAGQVVSSSFPSGARLKRNIRRLSTFYALAILPSALVPYRIVIEFVALSAFVLLVLVAAIAVQLVKGNRKEGRLFLIGWSGAIVGGIVTVLTALGLLPLNFLTEWSIQIGVTLQLIMLSSAYADKYNGARMELAGMHARLSNKVADLSAALERAEEASARARHATRLKNEFMATMSHEFRTPLNPIINIPQGVRQEFAAVRRAQCEGCSAHFELDEGDELSAETACPECNRQGSLVPRVAHRFTGDAQRARNLLAKVEHSGRHLLGLVNGILDFSKMQAGHLKLTRERVAVKPLLEELLRVQGESAARGGLALELELPDGELEVDADPARALQALNCLVDNAIKYSEPGGVITLRAARTGPSCAFSVRDRGIGIASENLERIFESFEQVHKGSTRKYGGTGLGLALARWLVRMHGGELRVQSELNQGSTFSFDLPLAPAAAQVRSA